MQKYLIGIPFFPLTSTKGDLRVFLVPPGGAARIDKARLEPYFNFSMFFEH